MRAIRCHPPSGPSDKDGAVTEERIWSAPRRANSCNFFKGSLIPCGEQREQEVLMVFLITSRQNNHLCQCGISGDDIFCSLSDSYAMPAGIASLAISQMKGLSCCKPTEAASSHCRVEVFWEGCQAFEPGRSCFGLQVLLGYFKQIPGLCISNAFRQNGDKVRRNSKISLVRKLSFWQHNHYLTGSE